MLLIVKKAYGTNYEGPISITWSWIL